MAEEQVEVKPLVRSTGSLNIDVNDEDSINEESEDIPSSRSKVKRRLPNAFKVFVLLGIALLCFVFYQRNYILKSGENGLNTETIDINGTLLDMNLLKVSDSSFCAKQQNISFHDLALSLLHLPGQSPELCTSDVAKQKTNSTEKKKKKNEHELHCNCGNPFQPIARVPTASYYWSRWDETFARNQAMLSQALKEKEQPQLVFLGDSITEHFVGTDMGKSKPATKDAQEGFDSVFGNNNNNNTDKKGSSLLRPPLVLGLAGDRCPQLLYRLVASTNQNNSASSWQPRIFWLLIGTNDLTDPCSAQTILVGNMVIILYLRATFPNAVIVVNSLLPRPNPKGKWFKKNRFYRPIHWINTKLQCLVKGMENVEFFNADPIFLSPNGTSDDGDDIFNVPLKLLPDRLHPSGKGTKLWMTKVREKALDILKREF